MTYYIIASKRMHQFSPLLIYLLYLATDHGSNRILYCDIY